MAIKNPYNVSKPSSSEKKENTDITKTSSVIDLTTPPTLCEIKKDNVLFSQLCS